MADSRSPDWRDIGHQAPASGPAGSKPWQIGDAAEPAAARSGQSVKRAVALLTLVAILVGIGWVLVLLRKPKPAFLFAIGSGYEQNLLVPPNVHGWNGLRRLYANEQIASRDSAFLWGQPTGMKKTDEPAIEWGKQSWNEIWKGLNVEKKDQKTVVIALSMHGLADADEVYLAPNVESLEAFQRSRVPFKEILKDLKSVGNKNVVLLLDLGPMQVNWTTGTLQFDFVERLQSLYKDQIRSTDNVVVVCSAGPGERSWGSDELQSSVFLHYLNLGLQGDALQGDAGLLKVQKLFDYLAKKVDDWARTNRARNQKPIMLGRDSAGDIDLVFIGAPFDDQKTQPAVNKFDPRSMLPAWQEWESLKKQSPWVYNPHVWRQYQALLMRYEQLQRCGDPTAKAEAVKASLHSLAKNLQDSEGLTAAMECLGNDFPMAQVLGYRSMTDMRNADDQLDQIRKTVGDEERSALFAPLAKKPLRERQALLVQLGRALLRNQRGYEQDQKTLAEIEAGLLLDQRPGELSPQRPTELQLLRMLAHVDSALGEDLAGYALSVRALAEEAALGSPAGNGPSYSEAILPRIQKQIEQADGLRREGEDLLFGDPKKEADKARAVLQQAETQYKNAAADALLWREALALRDEVVADMPILGRWLAFAPVGGSVLVDIELRASFESLGAKLSEMVEVDSTPGEVPPAPVVRAVKERHGKIADRYRQMVADLPVVPTQRNWHEYDHALSIPFTDAATRVRLLQQLQVIARELIAKGVGQAEIEEDPAGRFQRHKSLLVACQPYDVLQNNERFDKANSREFYKRMVEKCLTHADAPATEVKRLAEASNYCRVLPAALADAVPSKPFHPVERLRRIQMHQLLLWQARRTLGDHWFDGQEPYYLAVGTAYVDGANNLLKDDPNSHKLVETAQTFKKNELVDKRLVVTGGAKQQYWTTEIEFPLPWRIKADGVPKGKPMGWLTKGGNKELEARKVIALSGQDQVVTPFASLSWTQVWGSKGTEPRSSKVAFHAFYRGQTLREELDFDHPRVDVEVRQEPPPPNGNLALRMDPSFSYGAVSIVLDTSGSMKWAPHLDGVFPGPGERSRFEYAKDALNKVLDRLPDNTFLSVYRFGDDKAVKGDTAVEAIRAASPWSKVGKQSTALRNELEEMHANKEKYLRFASPIARAVIKSLNEGFPADYTGPRVLIALTDGDDNVSAERAAAELKDAGVPRNGVEIIVVCFIKKDRKEFDSARNQFGAAARVISVEQGEKLGERLADVLYPRLQLADRGTGTKELLEVGVDRLKSYSVKPGNYTARIEPFPDAAEVVVKDRDRFSEPVDIVVHPGDNLFIIPKRRDGRYLLERGLIGEQPEARESKLPQEQPDKDWLVTLLKSRVDTRAKLEQTILFERRRGVEKRIEQIQPEFVWLELQGADGIEGALRWQSSFDAAVPAFKLERPNWPVGQKDPRLSAWFWPLDRLSFEEKFGQPVRLSVGDPPRDDRPLPRIESADWDEKAKHLIVRAAFEPGKPAMILFRDLPAGASVQHDYYHGAGRVTAHIKGLSANPRNLDLLLVNVARFKQHSATLTAEFSPRISPPIEPPAALQPK